MTHKLTIAAKDKAWKLELEDDRLNGKIMGDTIKGAEIKSELDGYEFEITGGSDFAGLPMYKDAEGIGRKKVILTKGWGQHKKPKGDKKKRKEIKGLRLRKTVAGNTIHDKTVQINLKMTKEGTKKLPEIFPDQNKVAEPAAAESEKPAEQSAQTEQPKNETPKMEDKTEKIAEEIAEEVKEEIKDDIPSSPETKTASKKEEAAEKVAEEVEEEVEKVAENIANEEKKE